MLSNTLFEQLCEINNVLRMSVTAYVADGIARLSISQKNEAEDVVTKGFNELEPALEWAKEKRTS